MRVREECFFVVACTTVVLSTVEESCLLGREELGFFQRGQIDVPVGTAVHCVGELRRRRRCLPRVNFAVPSYLECDESADR